LNIIQKYKVLEDLKDKSNKEFQYKIKYKIAGPNQILAICLEMHYSPTNHA